MRLIWKKYDTKFDPVVTLVGLGLLVVGAYGIALLRHALRHPIVWFIAVLPLLAGDWQLKASYHPPVGAFSRDYVTVLQSAAERMGCKPPDSAAVAEPKIISVLPESGLE